MKYDRQGDLEFNLPNLVYVLGMTIRAYKYFCRHEALRLIMSERSASVWMKAKL